LAKLEVKEEWDLFLGTV